MSKGKKIALGTFLFVLAAGAVVGWVLYERYQAGAEEAAEVTAAPTRDLPVEEIRTKLQSGNFREKLAAKKQIDKLEPADRLAVLEALLKDPDVPTRLMAVSALGKIGGPEATALLKKVAAEDADETVKAAANERLQPAPAEGEGS